MPESDERLKDLARRVLDGEHVEAEPENTEDAEVLRGLRRLGPILEGFRADETAADGSPARPPDPSSADRHIAGFRLIRKLGEGGMGVVWEAEQDRPRRRVALKVIRGGVHVDEGTLRLFQREVQSLARLQHPAIAALYASGATDDGLHWFAMEMVRGITLQEWIRSRPAGPVTPAELRFRLQVFRKICDAVAYAHQRGVIHRDLKPANVIVAVEGAASPVAVPDIKVLDFGLARITESDTGMTSYHTELGRVRGTLPYMSPEQVRGDPAEIDLRTDVYALGVILYEMVSGKLPLDLAKASLIDAMRVICEEPPRSISATFAGTRRLDADVATMVGKALEKEAARRYASASALGEDVERWLHHQPIQGRPPSAAYQFRKLVLRHKLPFAFAGAVFVLLAVLAGVMTIQAARIARERDRANLAARRAEEQARRAEEEAETARTVSTFLENMFKVADPAESRGRTITAREILDKGAARIRTELANQPIVQMRLVNTIAHVYGKLGAFDEGRSLVRSMMPLVGRYPDRIESAELLAAHSLSLYGTEEALKTAQRSIEVRERVLPAGHPAIARGYWYVGIAQMGLWRQVDAQRSLETGLARLDAADRDDLELRVWFLNDLGMVSLRSGDARRARDYLVRALEVRKKAYTAGHPERLLGEHYVAYLDVLLNRFTAARPTLERLLREGEALWGRDSPHLGLVVHSIAELERRSGNYGRARALVLRAQRIDPGKLEHWTTLALAEDGLGRHDRAEQILRREIRSIEQRSGTDHPDVLTLLTALSEILSREGRTAEAVQLRSRADGIRSAYGLPAATGTVMGSS